MFNFESVQQGIPRNRRLPGPLLGQGIPVDPSTYGGNGPRVPSPNGGMPPLTDPTIGGIRPLPSPNGGMMPLGLPPRGMNGQMPPVKMGDAPPMGDLPTMPFSMTPGDQQMDFNRRKFKGLNPPDAIF